MLISYAVHATKQHLLQGITAVIKELHVKFPMVDYHDGTMLLAVGSARPAGHATPSQVQTRSSIANARITSGRPCVCAHCAA